MSFQKKNDELDFVIDLATIEELQKACKLMQMAIDFQQRNGYPNYRLVEAEQFRRDILMKRHFFVKNYSTLIGMFSIYPEDFVIWRELEEGDAIYLHRLIKDPRMEKLDFLRHVLPWIENFALRKNVKKLRLDTWSENPRLVSHYERFGFEIIEHFMMPRNPLISKNCWECKVVLMEKKISAQK